MLRAQGTGRHSREEIYAQGKADLDAVATLLGDQPFMLGTEPTLGGRDRVTPSSPACSASPSTPR